MNKFQKNKKWLTPGTILYHVTTGSGNYIGRKYRYNYHINTYIILGIYDDRCVDVINLKKYQESAPKATNSISYSRLYDYDFENIYFSKEKAEKICTKLNSIVTKHQQCEERRKKLKYHNLTITTGSLPNDIDSIIDMLHQEYQKLNLEVPEIRLTAKASNQLKNLLNILELAQDSIVEQTIYSYPEPTTKYVNSLSYYVIFDLPIDEDSLKKPQVCVGARAQIKIEYDYITPTSMKHVLHHYQFYEKIRKE